MSVRTYPALKAVVKVRLTSVDYLRAARAYKWRIRAQHACPFNFMS